MLKKYLEIGKIVTTHGIKGQVRIDSWCDSPEILSKIKKLYNKDGSVCYNVSSKPHKNQTITKIDGISTVESAEKLRGVVVYADRGDILKDKDAYFIQDLIGSRVCNADDENVCYGNVTEVFATGANDVYEVTDDNGKKSYIPVIDDVVISIDIENELIKIRPMKGMFDDED